MWREGADVKVHSNSDMSLERLGICLCHCPKQEVEEGEGIRGQTGEEAVPWGDELRGSILH